MVTRSALVIAAAIAVSACTTTESGSQLGARELAPEEKKIISDAVGRVLRDARSAKFQWAKLPAAGSGDVNYCASVDTRGAGKQLYVAVVGTENGKVKDAVVGAIHGGSDAHVVRALCKRHGLNPDDAV